MKRLIKHILKEEVKNQNVKKFLDYIVNNFLDSLELKDDLNERSFESISEMLDLGILNNEYDQLISDPELFGIYGWVHIYDEEEGEDYYYHRDDGNDPENYISSDEWHLEVGYDWLDDMVNTGDLGWDEEREVWFLTHPDILVKTKNNKFSFPLWWNPFKRKYDMPYINNPNNRIHLMRFIESYGIDSSNHMYDIIDIIFESIPDKVDSLLREKNLISENIIDNFIDFGKNYLSLPDDFKVILTDKKEGIETLANYDIGDKTIKVLSKNRAIPDIIRSIAHEMVHHQQNDRGDLRGNPEEGESGSPWEDEANSKAGSLVRKFGEDNPEIYDL
jgi:hypothetical protein